MTSSAVKLNSENRFPITSQIIPDWTNYEGLTLIQTIEKIFINSIKSLLCISLIPLAITATIDLLTYKQPEAEAKSPSTIPPDSNKTQVIATTSKTTSNHRKLNTFLDFFIIAQGCFMIIQGIGRIGPVNVPSLPLIIDASGYKGVALGGALVGFGLTCLIYEHVKNRK